MSPRHVYTLLALWVVGTLFWPYRFVRRWWLKLRLRRTLRATALRRLRRTLPMLLMGVPISGTRAQNAGDSLIGTVLSRSVIPNQWNGATGITVYCITWSAEIPERPHVLVVIDAAPADTTQSPVCPNPRGGNYPLWIDGPRCPPGNVSPFDDREWIIVRCGQDALARYRRAMEKKT